MQKNDALAAILTVNYDNLPIFSLIPLPASATILFEVMEASMQDRAVNHN